MNVGTAFGLTVEAVDAFGNLATNYGGSATIAMLNDPTKATLGGTLTQSFVNGLATFSGLTIGAQGSGYPLVASTQKVSVATNPISVFSSLQITGNPNSSVSIAFPDSTHFTVTINGKTTQYALSQYNGVVYQGPIGKFSNVIFNDPSRAYAAIQSLTSTQMVSSTFSFEADNVKNLFIYSGSSSTATVKVDQGTGANFYVDAANSGYSYIADPVNGLFSQLIGFGPETVTGSGGTTYAYIYSTSGASIVGDPAGTSVTVGGVQSKLGTFSQLYVLGATDGTDKISLNAQGGQFVGTPTFSYVTGTYQSTASSSGHSTARMSQPRPRPPVPTPPSSKLPRQHIQRQSELEFTIWNGLECFQRQLQFCHFVGRIPFDRGVGIGGRHRPGELGLERRWGFRQHSDRRHSDYRFAHDHGRHVH